ASRIRTCTSARSPWCRWRRSPRTRSSRDAAAWPRHWRGWMRRASKRYPRRLNPTPSDKPVTVPQLAALRDAGRKLAMLTAYDAGFARALDAGGVDIVLVGDSLGMVVQGHDSTLPVSVDDIAYHVAAVARGLRRALLLADLPFQSDATPERALEASTRLLQAGAGWPRSASWPRARSGCPRTWDWPRSRCCASAATGCRAARPSRPNSCVATRWPWPRPAPRCWCSNACPRPWPRRSPAPRQSPPSASAPGRTATARCWCCTTCSASTAATGGRSSSRISWPRAARWPARYAPTSTRCARAASPAPNTATADPDHDRRHRRTRCTARARVGLEARGPAGGAGADHGQPARRPFRPGGACAQARRPGGRQRLRQPDPVRAERGLRPLSAHPG